MHSNNSEEMERYAASSICQACNRSFAPKCTSPPGESTCHACKKFYWRCKKMNFIGGNSVLQICKLREQTSPPEACNANSSSNVLSCQHCRFERCRVALENRAEVMSERRRNRPRSRRDFKQIPCRICGCSSSGIHFGVVSCEGCKGFFRRSMTNNFRKKYYCKNNKKGAEPTSSINCEPNSNCRQCRLQRCLASGMSLDEVVIGRHTDDMRKEIDATVEMLAKSNAILQRPILRRKRKQVSPDFSEEESASTELLPKDCLLGATDQETYFSFTFSSSSPSYDSVIPYAPTTSSAEDSSSLEHSVVRVGHTSYYPFLDTRIEVSDWLIERTTEAASKLAPITSVKVIFPTSADPLQMVRTRSDSYVTYIQSVSTFLTSLPGFSEVDMQDRMTLYVQAFFPVLVAQLSLNFDIETQLPNHLSLDRPSGSWAQIANRQITRHMQVEHFLIETGNLLTKTIANLEEFSLLCALLCFSPDASFLGDVDRIRNIRTRYELALLHYSSRRSAGADGELWLANFYQLLALFRNAMTLFFGHLLVLPRKCGIYYERGAEPLMKELINHYTRLFGDS